VKRISPLALGTLAVIVVGYVTLALLHMDTTGYATLVGPVVAAALVASKLQDATDGQNTVLSEIHEQTNGKLTERLLTIVPAAVESVLKKHGLIPASTPTLQLTTHQDPAPAETTPAVSVPVPTNFAAIPVAASATADPVPKDVTGL
jgi:hypothetical protein